MAENTQEPTANSEQEEIKDIATESQENQEEVEVTEKEETGPILTTEERLTLEVSELKEKYLRLYADFENFRRRTSKEKLDLIGTANADLVKSMLPVVDDFERAAQSFESSSDLEALKEGVFLIQQKFTKTLESKGLKPMNAKGEVFDADLHESVAQFPAPSEDMKGKVIDELEKGYFLNDKVVRYAKVVVGQ
jgi:molecular chaperone GrpE